VTYIAPKSENNQGFKRICISLIKSASQFTTKITQEKYQIGYRYEVAHQSNHYKIQTQCSDVGFENVINVQFSTNCAWQRTMLTDHVLLETLGLLLTDGRS